MHTQRHTSHIQTDTHHTYINAHMDTYTQTHTLYTINTHSQADTQHTHHAYTLTITFSCL